MGFYAKFEATICIVVVQECQNKGWYDLSPWLDCTGLVFVAYQFCHLHRRKVVCNSPELLISHVNDR